MSPVHFGSSEMANSLDASGMTCCADTLFAALCHAAVSIEGPAGAEWLIRAVQNDRLRFTDCMPYDAEGYYLPRPCFLPEKRIDLPEEDRKVLKKAEWIPESEMEAYLATVRGESQFDWNLAKNTADFGTTAEITKVKIREFDDAEPYTVGVFRFYADAGLYFLVKYEEEDDLEKLSVFLEALGLAGIGGKISAGYGKFEAAVSSMRKIEWLNRALQEENQSSQLLLTAALPAEEELDAVLEGASYQLIRRAGFSHPTDSPSNERKKKTQYFLASGSVFSKRFDGDIYVVGTSETHQIYRYSRPMFAGVNL